MPAGTGYSPVIAAAFSNLVSVAGLARIATIAVSTVLLLLHEHHTIVHATAAATQNMLRLIGRNDDDGRPMMRGGTQSMVGSYSNRRSVCTELAGVRHLLQALREAGCMVSKRGRCYYGWAETARQCQVCRCGEYV